MAGQHHGSEPGPALADVLSTRRGEIIALWEGRMRTLPSSTPRRPLVLRDHVQTILERIAEGSSRGMRRIAPLELDGGDPGRVIAEYQALGQSVHEVSGGVALNQLSYFDDAINAAIVDTVKALQASEERLRALFDHSPTAMWIKDIDGRYVMINRACATLLGKAPDEIVGRLEHDFVAEDVVEAHLANDRRAIETGNAIEIEEWLPYAGETRSFLSIKFAVKDPQNKPLVCGIATDITDRERIERGHRFLAGAGRIFAGSLDYEHTIAQATELATPAIADACTVDVLEAGTLRRIVAVADTAEVEAVREFVGAGAPSLDSNRAVPVAIRSRASILLPVLDEQAFDRFETPQPVRRSIRALGIQTVMVVPLIGRMGVVGAIAFGARGRRYGPLDLGIAEGLARVAADAIENARLYKEAQEASHHRDDVLAIVSHDLRSPLAAIRAASQMLGRCAVDILSAKHLEIIQRATQRMDRLIGDLLQAATIRAGRLVVTPRPEQLPALLTESLNGSTEAAKKRGINLERRFPAEPIEVSCDRVRVVQVVSNLLGNALKFCREGETVTLGAEVRERDVRVSVSDTGPGIEPNDLANLFDPYWSARRHADKGTGLGLFISKGLIEAHGGTMGVESQVGRGSTFWFTLPRA